jgi:hypothetical protein
MTDDQRLAIARRKLYGEWRRADLQRALNIKQTKAGNLIREWEIAGYITVRYSSTAQVCAWAADEPMSGTAQTDGQIPPHTPASARKEPSVSLRDAAIGVRVLVVVVLAVVVLLPLGAALLNWRPTVVEHPANVPAISPTIPATSTPERHVPTFWAPNGEPSGEVPVSACGPIQARYGMAWGQLLDQKWVRIWDCFGADPAQVADLAPTPTARVEVVYQQIPVHSPPPAPAPTAAPQPTAAPADVVQVSEPRPVEPGGSYLVCHPQDGCICSTVPGPYQGDWRVVLSDISEEMCMREAGW